MMKTADKIEVMSLIYHDVVEREVHQQSGFPGADAASYKLDPELFKMHLGSIARSVSDRPTLVTELLERSATAPTAPWTITFDDGGESFHSRIADLLEEYGWRAHFFVATDYIGKPGFMSGGQIRDLHRRGHLIGSHSCSHPLRFATRPREEMFREWSDSLRILSDLLDEPVRIASLPGGQYSKQVAESAAEAGFEALFTSEPTSRPVFVDGCMVLGRYSIQRWTTPDLAAALASGRFLPRYRQMLWWEFKKLSKTVGGNLYLELRSKLMNQVNPESAKASKQ